MNIGKRLKNLGMTLAVLAITAASLFAGPVKANTEEIMSSTLSNVKAVVESYKNDGIGCSSYIENFKNQGLTVCVLDVDKFENDVKIKDVGEYRFILDYNDGNTTPYGECKDGKIAVNFNENKLNKIEYKTIDDIANDINQSLEFTKSEVLKMKSVDGKNTENFVLNLSKTASALRSNGIKNVIKYQTTKNDKGENVLAGATINTNENKVLATYTINENSSVTVNANNLSTTSKNKNEIHSFTIANINDAKSSQKSNNTQYAGR